MNLNFSNDGDNKDSNNNANSANNSDGNITIYVCKKSLGNVSINIDESQEWYMKLTKHQHISDVYTYISKLIRRSRCFNVIPNNVLINNKRANYQLTVSAKFSESILENVTPIARTVANKSTDNSVRNTAKALELISENFQVTDATVSLSFKDNQTDSQIAQVSESVKNVNPSDIIKKATALLMGVSDSEAESFKNSVYYQDENIKKKLSGKAIISEAFLNSYRSLLKELIDKNYISNENYVEKVVNSVEDLEPKVKANTKKVSKKKNKKK